MVSNTNGNGVGKKEKVNLGEQKTPVTYSKEKSTPTHKSNATATTTAQDVYT